MILNRINDSLCTGTRALDRELLEFNLVRSPTTPVDDSLTSSQPISKRASSTKKKKKKITECGEKRFSTPSSYVKRVLCNFCQLSNDQWKSEDDYIDRLGLPPSEPTQPLGLEPIIATRYSAYSISWRNGVLQLFAANQHLSSNTGLPLWKSFDTIHTRCDYGGI